MSSFFHNINHPIVSSGKITEPKVDISKNLPFKLLFLGFNLRIICMFMLIYNNYSLNHRSYVFSPFYLICEVLKKWGVIKHTCYKNYYKWNVIISYLCLSWFYDLIPFQIYAYICTNATQECIHTTVSIFGLDALPHLLSPTNCLNVSQSFSFTYIL